MSLFCLLPFLSMCDKLISYHTKGRIDMAGIDLGFDEVVLSELNNAHDASSFTTKLCNVVLTNKRIIISKIGAFGKTKLLFDKPLSDVKTYNGNAQVKLNSVSGVLTQIDVYLSSGKLSFKLTGAGNTDAIRFANELNHIVTETDADLYSESGNDTGAKAFMKTFLGQTSAEIKKVKNEKVALRCAGCGASFEGIKGRVAKCPYCGSVYNT